MDNHNKLIVIGLDGAPYQLIRKWTQSGDLPNLGRLIQQGNFNVLKSTIPVHSPTAWSSFITGLNPGKHGVFDFVRRDKEDYQLRVVQANEIKGTSLWKLLGQQGAQVGVMNVPMTYPPEPVNGYLISGLGTPDYVPYTYPPELSEQLNAAGYRVNKKFFYTPGRDDEWLEDISSITEERGKTAVRLLKEKPWDFFMVVFRNTDEIGHFFWRHMDESHPRHDPNAPARYKTAILDLYRQVDRWVGEIVTAAGPDTNILIMSDHGMGPLYRDVFINEWLWKQGWLMLKETADGKKNGRSFFRKIGLTRKNISDALTRLNLHRVEVIIKQILGDRIRVLPRDERPEFINAIDWSKTKAYSFGYYGQIFINLKGREPEGIVEPGEAYETLRQEIIRGLSELTDPEDGRPVVDRVYTREELFHGPSLEQAPDLLTIMRDLTYITRKDYEFASERGILFRQPYTDESGSHHLDGILIMAGPDIEQRGDSLPASPHIPDVTPTILHLMNCPIPSTMDGQVLGSLISAEQMKNNPIRYVEEALEDRQDENSDWDAEAEAEVMERLKKLGYLG
ncbi:MAG: alkaline phosphatase family protein [Candidatus Promineifilaceae bacterium]